MKNVFAVLGILAVIVLALNDSEPRDEYTRDDIEGAWHEGYEKGYEEGYAEAEHYSFGNPSGPSGHLPLHRGGFGWVPTRIS